LDQDPKTRLVPKVDRESVSVAVSCVLL
jgi:hypothetical protein